MPAIELINTPLYLDSALIAYWRFEGNSNATIGGLNGTDYNMSYSAGQFGSCAVFNGSSSRIDLANSTIFDVQRLTISAWVYSTNFVQAGFIFEKGSVNTQYSLGIHGSPGIILTTVNSIGAYDTILRIVPTVLTNSVWNHIASTYDGQTKRIYVNGILNGSSAYTETLQTGQSGERIGAYGGASPAYWLNGKIDDLAVFSRALTPQEIYDLYNGSLDQNTKESLSKYRRNAQRLVSPNIKPASAPHNKLLQNTALFNDSSLWGYWKLDGNSLDSKASNNGTDTSITYPQENDYRGKPALFNGSTSHIQVTNCAHGTADFTYSWWVKYTRFPIIYNTYFENGTWVNSLIIRQDTTNTLWVGAMASPPYASFNFTPVVNKWHHLALVKNSASSWSLTLYIDGMGISSNEGTAFAANIAPSANMWFGASQHSSTQCVNAYMSDVAIFTRALSTAEVLTIYGSPVQTPIMNTPLAADPNLIAYWPLDGNSNDYKGVLNGTDYNITYAGSRYDGQFGSCAYFNGTSGRIDIANSTAFDVQRLTISAWVLSSNFNQTGFIFEKGSVNTQYSFGFHGGNIFIFFTMNSIGTWQQLGVRVDGLTTSTGGVLPWHHIVATYDGAFKKVYIDGILCGSVAYTETLQTGQSGERIGAYGGASPAYWFNGFIDDLAVFSRALSAAEISDYYNGTMTQMAPGGLKQYKRLENNTQAKELDSVMPASPLNIGGCKLWIDASQITGKNDGDKLTGVPLVIDRSGNGNDLHQRMDTIPTTDACNPYYKTNILNGLPVMRHTIAAGTTWDIAWSYAAPNTLFFVGKKTAATSGRGISGRTTNFLMGYWDAYENQMFADGYVGYLGGTSPVRTTYPYIWSAVVVSPISSLWKDGVATKSGTGITAPGGLTIGYLGTSEFSDLDIGEIIGYNRLLTDAERWYIEKYLGDKWGVPVLKNSVAKSAIGGTITYADGYTVHYFSGAGTFTPNFTGNVEVYQVAGGGSGGQVGSNYSVNGGGGGGGGVYDATVSVTAGTAYSVVVGGGGAVGSNGSPSDALGVYTAYGGGRGAPVAGNGSASASGFAGGCGGGGGSGDATARSGGATTQSGRAGDSYHGQAGGSAAAGAAYSRGYAGGGGGGGAAGGAASGATYGAAGGAGAMWGFVAPYQGYSGGGGGSGFNAGSYYGGAGGTYGGGAGGGNGTGSLANGVSGTANRGGGGGGSAAIGSTAGSGGSGMVQIKYLTP